MTRDFVIERIECIQNELQALKAHLCGSPSPDECRIGKTLFCELHPMHEGPHENGQNRWLKKPMVFCHHGVKVPYE